ncbi:putative B3 domain-containing protein Os03g0621600 [Apium graveolens]|uniref:putative B3 domain-containing protein Os03g0621600 n=1 Tax=Apium graveolens TaxID=4045 RepID=UPI003D799DCC
MIPRKFVKKYETNLDYRVSLNSPNGLAWPVKLERHEADAWPESARFYSIQFGYLLVSRYRGHCNFKVRVFDPSSMEIESPSSRGEKLNSGESSQVRKRPIETDDSTCSDLTRPRKKRVGKLPSKDASHDGVSKLGDREIKEAEARALASAEAFTSDNPFFFHVMRKTYVDGKGRVLLVSCTYLDEPEQNNVLLGMSYQH